MSENGEHQRGINAIVMQFGESRCDSQDEMGL
jgi:hypothetical protein